MLSFISAAMLALLLSYNVTKEDVRRLLNAGVSEQTIVEFIRRNAPAEPLSVEDVMELKAAGAGDAVLNAMLEASRASEAVAPSKSSNSYGDSYTYPGTTYSYSYPEYSYAPYASFYYPYYYYPYYYPYYYRPYRYYYPYSSYRYYPYRYPYYQHYNNNYRYPYSVSPYRNPHPQQVQPMRPQQQPVRPQQQSQPRPQPTQPRQGAGTYRR